MTSVAYLVSRYPAVSHTFVRREVAALRRQGLAVETFSVRRPGDGELRTDADHEERRRTFYVLPVSPMRLAAAHARMFARDPFAYGRAFRLAERHRPSGAKASLWAAFHFAEAVVLADELAARGIRHLHTHFANAGGTVGYLASRLLGIGFSQTLHGYADFDGPMNGLLAEKIAASRFTACVSRFGRDEALRRSGSEHAERLRLVRCGIELERFPQRESPPPGPPWRILTVGRLAPEKGQHLLVRAFAQVVRRGVDAELVLVGEGPERERLEAEVAAAGLGDRVHLRGALGEAGVREELAKAHIFALSSFVEGLPVVLMEAMASGVPVVAPRLTGIPELVEHERTGLLFTTGSEDELASALYRMLSDHALGQRLVEAGRAKVVLEFDVERAVEPLLTAFREALQNDPGAAPSRGRTAPPQTANPR